MRYTPQNETIVSLGIPLDQALNLAEVEAYKYRKGMKELESITAAIVGTGVDPGTAATTTTTTSATTATTTTAAAATDGTPSPAPAPKRTRQDNKDSKEEEEEPEVPSRVPLMACFNQMAAAESVEFFMSPALDRRVTASKTRRFRTFPPYLLLQMRRYYLDETWVGKKLAVLLDVPDELDLSHLRGYGLREDEVKMEDQHPAPGAVDPVTAAVDAASDPNVEPDPEIVASMTAMGI